MNEVPEAPAAPASPNRLRRFWRHPVTQMFARIVFFVAAAAALAWLLRRLLPMPSLESLPAELAQSPRDAFVRLLRSAVAIAGAYWLMVRVMERRPVDELAPGRAPAHLATGWLLGTGILVATALVLALLGYYRVKGLNPDPNLLAPLFVLGLGPGIVEEIISRGILFRVVEEASGTWFALVLSAALFGLGHAANPNATWWSSTAIAVEAGLLLGLAYAWTRSMWFVMALHAAWNFTQGPLLGIPVSGIAVPDSLLESSLTGPVLLSGGEFGAEGSIFAVLICVSVAVWCWRGARAHGRIVPPFWRRRQADGSYPALRFQATLARAPVPPLQ